MVDFPAARTVRLPDVSLSVHEAGEGPAIVLLHGFPEIAYSWRHQISALADAGFRVIAPNQRGYADSSSPNRVADYDLVHLTDDLAALLDALEVDRAVFAGHDWGGFVSWAMPVCHPDRCLGAVGVNTPYMPFPATDQLRQVFKEDERFYILWFQQRGVAEVELDANPRIVFEKLMRYGSPPVDSRGLLGMVETGGANPFRGLDDFEPSSKPMLGGEEIDVYVRAFERSGFFGPVSWYRNIDRNLELVPDMGVRKLDLPCLQVLAEWDIAIPPAMAAGMGDLCSDLEMCTIQECGHWTQQEKPEELSRLMIDWLVPRFRF